MLRCGIAGGERDPPAHPNLYACLLKESAAMVQCGRLNVARTLHTFVEQEALPGTGIASDDFWSAFDAIVHDLAPKKRALLKTRADLQAKIDAWHRAQKG